MGSLIDLHCHILPGIDDGAQDILCTKKMLEMSVKKGISNFVFTPHFYPERIDVYDFIQKRNLAVDQMKDIAKNLGIQFRIGAEVQFTPILDSLPLKELAFSGTNYLLLELLTLYEPPDVEGLIRRICNAGYIPILAHIERFPYIEQNPQLLYQWVKAGALVQVNAGWILNDSKARKRLNQYYHWNLVHVMASDTHSVIKRPQNLADAYQILPVEMAADFQANAKAIFEGKSINWKLPVKPRRFLGRWK